MNRKLAIALISFSLLFYSSCCIALTDVGNGLGEAKVVVVQNQGELHGEGVAGALNVFLNRDFPIQKPQLNALLLGALKQRLSSYKNIKIMSPKDFGQNYDSQLHLEQGEIYLFVKFTYWAANDFSPSLNQDILVMQVKKKTAVPPHMINILQGGTIREWDYPVTLISIPTGTVNIESFVKVAFDDFVKKSLVR